MVLARCLVLVAAFVSVFSGPVLAAGTMKHAGTAFVQLFEWTWKDIATECETFLGPKGFQAVQISPPNEHALLPGGPWYQRYQAVSYQLQSRSGTRDEFVDMVRRCRAAGVSIYADVIINHMTGVNRTGQTKFGFAGSPYGEYVYPGLYEAWDFHRCGRNGDDRIVNYQDRWEVQNCNLSRLADLRTESEYVRGRIADYLNELLQIGVAGFRVDGAKHIPVEDLQAIYSRLHKPFYALQEILDYGAEPIKASEYFETGDVTEFRYGSKLAEVFNGGKLAWLRNFGEAWGFQPSEKAIVFVDNHDTQRGHAVSGALSHRDGQKYVLATIFMLAWPYGYPQLMSSYRFNDSEQGPPATPDGKTRRIHGPDGVSCGNEWICEHRWAPVANLLAFRNYVQDAPVVRWWSNGESLISFARGNRGFVVINNEAISVNRWFDTGLAPGSYCDVASGQLVAKSATAHCMGPVVQVNVDGWAEVRLPPYGATVIHGGARLKRN